MKVQKPSIAVRIAAWLRGGKVVWIMDYVGEVRASIATRNAFGVLTCHVYWLEKVGSCILLDDGYVSTASASNYVEKWKYA